MRLQKIPFRNTEAFSEFFLKYIEKKPSLKSFYGNLPGLQGIGKQISLKSKAFSGASRQTLVEVLGRQYAGIKPTGPVAANIQSLRETKCFTVTTGHQLSILTGPLYFIYKIVTAINACRALKKKYPSYRFVPVHWMASEDHDYQEIKSIRLYGKKYTWETSQKGAVGRFNPKDMESMLRELPGDVSMFRNAYLKNQSLSGAVREYLYSLFGKDGLVVIDADDRELKNSLKPVMKEDILQNTPSKKVTETNLKLKSLGFDPQVNPREINFFFLDNNIRGRLERAGDRFNVVDTNLSFSESELLQLVDREPEKFSPNVILRPLYQEIILPNLAYVGGPAELVYWLQLKSMFEFFKVPFPVLLPRNFALVVDHAVSRKLTKTQLSLADYFLDTNLLAKKWVGKNSRHELSLQKALKTAEKLFEEVRRQSGAVDPTLELMTAGHAQRTKKAIANIEHKMLRAEKRNQSDKIRQIESVKDALFPDGELQERTDNFLNFFQQDPDFIQKLLKHFDPFDFRIHSLSYP